MGLTAWRKAHKPRPTQAGQPTAPDWCHPYRQRAASKAWTDPPTKTKSLGPDSSAILILNSLEQDQGFPVGLELGPVCHSPIKHNCLLVKQRQVCLRQMLVY